MRGPVIFLVSLAAVTIAAVGLFIPIHRERLKLEGLILDRDATAGAGHTPSSPRQIAELAQALGGPRRPAEAVHTVRSLALDFSPIDLIEIDERRVTFPAAWRDVPRLLGRLSRLKGLVYQNFSAEPAEDPERCLITLEVVSTGDGNEAR